MPKKINITNIGTNDVFEEQNTKLIDPLSVNYMNIKQQHPTKHVAEMNSVLEAGTSYFCTLSDAIKSVRCITEHAEIVKLLCDYWQSYQDKFRICLAIDLTKFPMPSDFPQQWIQNGANKPLEYIILILDVTDYRNETLSADVQTTFPLPTFHASFTLEAEVCTKAYTTFSYFNLINDKLDFMSSVNSGASIIHLINTRPLDQLLKNNIFAPKYPFLHQKIAKPNSQNTIFLNDFNNLISAFNEQQTAFQALRTAISEQPILTILPIDIDIQSKQLSCNSPQVLHDRLVYLEDKQKILADLRKKLRKEVIDYFNEHYGENFKPDELSAYLGIHKSKKPVTITLGETSYETNSSIALWHYLIETKFDDVKLIITLELLKAQKIVEEKVNQYNSIDLICRRIESYLTILKGLNDEYKKDSEATLSFLSLTNTLFKYPHIKSYSPTPNDFKFDFNSNKIPPKQAEPKTIYLMKATNQYFFKGMKDCSSLPKGLSISDKPEEKINLSSILGYINKKDGLPSPKPISIQELDTITSHSQQEAVISIQEHIARHLDEYELARDLDEVLFKDEINLIMQQIATNMKRFCLEINFDPEKEQLLAIINQRALTSFQFDVSTSYKEWMPKSLSNYTTRKINDFDELSNDIQRLSEIFSEKGAEITNYAVYEKLLRTLNIYAKQLSNLKTDYPYAFKIPQIEANHVEKLLHYIKDNLLYKLNFYHKFIALDPMERLKTQILNKYLPYNEDNTIDYIQRIYMPMSIVETILEQINNTPSLDASNNLKV